MASALVHSFAILSCVALFLGTVGLTIRLQSGARQAMHLPFTALVVYGFSAVAVMIAGGLSGFVLPELMARMARDVVSTQQVYRLIISSLFQINQAFSRIYSVGGWLAILILVHCCLGLPRPSAYAFGVWVHRLAIDDCAARVRTRSPEHPRHGCSDSFAGDLVPRRWHRHDGRAHLRCHEITQVSYTE